MYNKIKSLTCSLLLMLSYSATAADGDFTGNIKFMEKESNSIQFQRFDVPNTAKNFNSGIKVITKTKHLTFVEKLESARDK